MSHLPDYFDHLISNRGMSQDAAVDKLAAVQNAMLLPQFPVKKPPPDEDDEEMKIYKKRQKKKKRKMPDPTKGVSA